MNSFELFDHTADVGLRVRAETFDLLLSVSTRAILSLLLENPESTLPKEKWEWTLESEDPVSLYVDWLRELIYQFETEQILVCQVSFDISNERTRLTAQCQGECTDWSRHLPGNELKAVTYHGLIVKQVDDGWMAEVILDI